MNADAAQGRQDAAPVPITIAHGDGIGPEIMEASLRVLEAAGARLAPERIDIGEQVYRQGVSSGIEPSAWDSLRRTRVFYKAPITTPLGGGFKSLNVTVRKSLGLFANVRPCTSLAPFVPTLHPEMDLVIVRENEEDLYAGIEHRQTDEVAQCLKLISRPGTERIIRYAFEYARANGRRKVSCFSKDNIMKITDGFYHRIFEEVAAEYPELEHDHWIIDIGTARLATRPELFDVIVTSNLYGDIISDVAAEVSGSVGLGASANIGEHCAMFEAIHGSAPDIAGQGIANPSGLLLAGVQMLVHVGQPEVAARIHNAWLATIEDGIHTGDIYREGTSQARVGTAAFADAVIERLGTSPTRLAAVSYGHDHAPFRIPEARRLPPQKKDLVGIDVFVHWASEDADALAERLQAATPGDRATLEMITNRGTKVWPHGLPETFRTDHWRCRFTFRDGGRAKDVVALLGAFEQAGIDFVKTEHLYNFDGVPGYSLGQGQ
ncbi:MAG: NADP-dependent isocitrate dehydrogenase [Pseudomonadales bacterium]|jgi:isocitrate dehydrogenase|nr:NADP-dependent isocitrate dehydrogenase [Pseudomonadales bacterium]